MEISEWVAVYQRSHRTMSDSAGNMLKKLFPHSVRIEKTVIAKHREAMEAWLSEMLDTDEFVWGFNQLHFKDDNVAMQFKLAWAYQ